MTPDLPPCWCSGTRFRSGPFGAFAASGDRQVPFAIFFCTACGTGQTMPRPVAIDYSATATELNDRVGQLDLWRKFARDSLTVVQRYRHSGRLLDVGCNIGVLVDEAVRAGFAASGIDPDRAAVAFGRDRFNCDLQNRNLQSLPAGSFDIVMLEQTLEHVPAPAALLAEVRRVLAPGGIAVVSVPHYRGLVARVAGAAWYGWWPHEHIWHFTVPALRQLLTQSGLAVAGLHYARLHHERNWRSCRGMVVALADALAALVPQCGDKIFIVGQKGPT